MPIYKTRAVNTNSASGLFYKLDGNSVAFTATSGSTISVKSGTVVDVNGTLVAYQTDTALTMPTLTAGTDYAIYACADGSIRSDASFTAPTGYTTSNSRKIGGFHYAPGGNAAAQSGGSATPAINPYSLWDLKWRPSCPDPRGMTLVAGAFWCDIYLLGVDHYVNGTSKYGVTIADGSSPPKIPAAFGGNGSNAYSSLNWWQAAECATAAGKRLLGYNEYAAAAYGVSEGTSVGADPVSTALDQLRTSKWGLIQATGNMWVWGRDLGTYRGDNTGTWGWNNSAGGRGQMYITPSNLAVAVLGGSWFGSGDAGSRASYWSDYPWYASSDVGARCLCDHLNLV
jgi:hypothetical protein